ncbi:membrane-spanning 4-domains subfamily A member 15-like [Crotalus adamanteus]|uniref:Membrane-spanning 4-domains subfamily A member 15-like n=1 Tax=Crotalus adamanteus TaxID=8729 RepID=A0AAW1C9A7_CROAD
MERFLSAETKVLGAIQIMIGLIHIGFGAAAICLTLFPSYYLILSVIGGYPFWGGIFFISSGSLCVAAVNRPNRGLVKSSVGLNITSAIMALTGIILYLCELIFNSTNFRYIYLYNTEDLNQITTIRNVSYGFSSLLLFFSLLEFCIAVSLAHFGCQATCCSDAQPTMLFVPYQVIGGGADTPEPNPSPPPPTYDNVFRKESSRRLGATPCFAALPVQALKRASRKLQRESVEGKVGGGGDGKSSPAGRGLRKELEGRTDGEAVVTVRVLLFFFWRFLQSSGPQPPTMAFSVPSLPPPPPPSRASKPQKLETPALQSLLYSNLFCPNRYEHA